MFSPFDFYCRTINFYIIFFAIEISCTPDDLQNNQQECIINNDSGGSFTMEDECTPNEEIAEEQSSEEEVGKYIFVI